MALIEVGSLLSYLNNYKGYSVYWCRHTSPHEVSGAQCFSRRLILALFELVFVFSVGGPGPTPSRGAGSGQAPGRAPAPALTERSKRDGPRPGAHAGAHGHGRRPGAGVPTRQRDSISVMKSPRLRSETLLYINALNLSPRATPCSNGCATLARLPADRAAEPQPASPASTSRPT